MLKVNNLTGGYHRSAPLLKNVTLSVAEGEWVALVGLNGAGKSTLLKHMIGLMDPYQGDITIGGISRAKNPETYRRQFFYIPEMPIFYDELSLYEHLRMTAMVYGLDEATFSDRASELLRAYRLEQAKDRLPIYFSKGMRQKMHIVQALLLSPPLYILDEPLLGLDPLGMQTLLEALAAERDNGRAILMSTHLLSMAARWCDRFVVMHEGRILWSGTLKEMEQEVYGPEGNVPSYAVDGLYLDLLKRLGGEIDV
ncbi:MAG: ABC transporter, ATP-binding protein EcsA [Candidatus Carbobacillus altaicus]|uniref:ABC transporter, ATP-binding protein EcsA n=1 Tax=Candidatus Carbonibacillus altaicus TaxID=2163959 RepID=A0A2R6XZB4_9BACL|nr:MAG: ABC transporter, ATP-binding protein EcsA [Candidatus Carbobacillus altaicus]